MNRCVHHIPLLFSCLCLHFTTFFLFLVITLSRQRTSSHIGVRLFPIKFNFKVISQSLSGGDIVSQRRELGGGLYVLVATLAHNSRNKVPAECNLKVAKFESKPAGVMNNIS